MTDKLDKILINKASTGVFSGVDLSDTALKGKSKFHNWRNYVPDFLEENWHLLTDRERLIVLLTANEAAFNEDWD